MPLTPNQARIVAAPLDRCILVNAGPGTGKTHVLVERVHHLVSVCGVPLDAILVVTFSTKAARELRERVARRLLEARLVTSSLELETGWIVNFHGLCYRILREHALAARFEPGSRVQDQVESSDLAAELRRRFWASPLVDEALLAEERGDPIPCAVVERVGRAYTGCVQALGRAREWREDSAAVLARAEAALTALPAPAEEEQAQAMGTERAAQAFFARCLPEVEREYEASKRQESLLDFVDLQTRAVQFLETAAGSRVRERFRAVLVDEFQDTNPVQLRLIEQLCAPALANLMAVGDDRQAIYAFRGARVANLRELPGRVAAAGGECQVMDLYESFRSYQEILDVSSAALGYADEDPDPPAQTPARIQLLAAALGPAHDDALAARPVVRTGRFDDKASEADGIAAHIASLVGRPIAMVDGTGSRSSVPLRWGHFALLLRSVGSAKLYEDALRARGIPYRTFGGTGFYDRREILDLLAYLQVIANPYDGLALIRVLQNPPFGLSDRSLHALANVDMVGRQGESPETDAHEHKVIPGFRLEPFDAVRRALTDRELAQRLGLGAETLGRLERLCAFLMEATRRRGTTPVSRLLLEVLEATGYGKLLLAEDAAGPLEALRRRKNVERLLRMARRQEDRNVYGSLQELVRYLRRALEEEVAEAEEGIEADGRVVNLMTVHQAKGMEWPIVFVAGLVDRSWPMRGYPEEVIHSPEGGIYLRRSVLGEEEDGQTKFAETRLHASLTASEQLAREEEERRVLFVAMTRAKNLLFLSGFGPKTRFLDRVSSCLPADHGDASAPEALPAMDAAGAATHAGPVLDPQELERAIQRALAPGREPVDASRVLGGPLVVHLSFSQIDLFATCPLRYKFTHVVPLPGVRHTGSLAAQQLQKGLEPARLSPAELGTVFHDALERWASEDRPLLELVADAARDRGWGELAPADLRHAQRFATHFLASRLGQRRPAPDETEVPFTLLLGESAGLVVTLSGSIDRIDPDPDGRWTITDYKTNRGVEPERYELQLSIYRLAMERVFDRRVACSQAYFVRYPESAGLREVETLDPAETEAKVLSVAERIAGRDFSLQEAPEPSTCWRCPFGGREGFCPEKRLSDERPT